MFGPSVGFMMASYALRQYVDPSLTPVIDNKDPRWIGAWWMGKETSLDTFQKKNWKNLKFTSGPDIFYKNV